MWVKVLQIPRPYLHAGILAFAGLGACALRFNIVDILYLVHSPFAIVACGALAVIIATCLRLKRRKAKVEASPKLVPPSAISAIEEPRHGRR